METYHKQLSVCPRILVHFSIGSHYIMWTRRFGQTESNHYGIKNKNMRTNIGFHTPLILNKMEC